MQTVIGLDSLDRLDKRPPLTVNLSFDRDDLASIPAININLQSRSSSDSDSDSVSSTKSPLFKAVLNGINNETDDRYDNLCIITSKLMKIAEKFQASGEEKKLAVIEAIQTHLYNTGCERHKTECIVKKVLPGLIDTLIRIDSRKICLKDLGVY